MRTPRLLAGLLLLGGLAGALAGCGASPVPADARPLPDGTTVTVRGHREVLLIGDAVLPRFQGERPPGLCLRVPPGVDTSQWRGAVFFLEQQDQGLDRSLTPRPPSARVGDVLCFDRPPVAGLEQSRQPHRWDLCGWVEDAYDGTAYRLPCRSLVLAPRSTESEEILERVLRAVAERNDRPLARLFATLEDQAAQARARGLPWLAVRIDLIGVHYRIDEGDAADRRAAAAILASLPPWLDAPAAAPLHADALYLEGLRELHEGKPERAWRHFLDTEELYHRHLDPKRLAAVQGQAMVLIRVGAIRDGILRLEQALASCAPAPGATAGGGAPCNSRLQRDVRGLAAWMILLDSTATPQELSRAGEELEELSREEALGAQERANHLVNLALLRARQGRDPAAPLKQAALLAGASDSRRAELVERWGALARALHRLTGDRGDLDRSRQLCRELAREAPTTRLAAWAHSCLGRIHERRGEPLAAAWMLGRALQLHGRATPAMLGRLLPLGPGQRADDHYRAARVMLQLGDPARAWHVLEALDHLPDQALRGTPAAEDPASPRELPSPKVLREPDRALGPLSSLVEDLPAASPPHARYRAFALDDEIFLLSRSPTDGTITLLQRTPFSAGSLSQAADDLRTALDARHLNDGELRRLLAPFVAGLIPHDIRSLAAEPPRADPPVLLYALHGPLQEVPLDALPLPDPSPAGRWLGEVAIPAVRPALLDAGAAPPVAAAGRPLVILDPTGDLGTRREGAELYRRTFPSSRVLLGNAADRHRVLAALPGASWFHADTHGEYDPAFPERSSLRLADGELTVRDLTTLRVALEFANLSGCRTGRWPTSADSGRYGLAGMFARRGTGWVVASRADLLNDLARDLNPVFYRQLAAGTPVPLAWHRSMEAVRARHPAVAWASLFLLRGATPLGQTGLAATPYAVNEGDRRP